MFCFVVNEDNEVIKLLKRVPFDEVKEDIYQSSYIKYTNKNSIKGKFSSPKKEDGKKDEVKKTNFLIKILNWLSSKVKGDKLEPEDIEMDEIDLEDIINQFYENDATKKELDINIINLIDQVSYFLSEKELVPQLYKDQVKLFYSESGFGGTDIKNYIQLVPNKNKITLIHYPSPLDKIKFFKGFESFQDYMNKYPIFKKYIDEVIYTKAKFDPYPLYKFPPYLETKEKEVIDYDSASLKSNDIISNVKEFNDLKQILLKNLDYPYKEELLDLFKDNSCKELKLII